MSSHQKERRESRCTIQDLRHHLRDADQERFHLTVALARLVGEQKPDRNTFRTMGVIVAIAAAIGAAVSTAGAPARRTPVVANSASPMEISPTSSGVLAEVVPAQSVQRPARTRTTRTATKQPAGLKPAKVRRPTSSYQRPVPRPLSPAEFGRRDSQIAANQ
jgi:hypothetical protein